MALSAKLISFLLLLTLFSLKIQARQSQFFSKVPSSNSDNNVPETTLFNTEEQNLSEHQQEPTSVPESQKTTLHYQEEQKQTLNKKEEDPTFVPETENGYGLYGHETGQFPPTTSTAQKYQPYTTPTTTTGGYEPYTTPTTTTGKYESYTTPTTTRGGYEPYTTPTTTTGKYESYTTTTRGGYEPYTTPTTTTGSYEPYTTPITSTAVNYEPYTTQNENQQSYNNYPNNNNYYNKNAFYTAQDNLGGPKYQENGYTSLANQNQNKFYYGGNNGYNGEKQGMSDTRFLENGKYYYDAQSERDNYPNQYQNTGNEYNTRSYNGNNEKTYEYNNSMEDNQNQYEFDELED